jgi:glycosyltransferase involved in cell wall biosynthesis
MASGLAVVAYDYAAARQHIENGVNGFTVPFDDSGAFVDAALSAAVGDLSEIREEARASARKVRWKKVVKRFENQLEALVSPATADPVSVPAL